jgi:hypothetical protein
VHTAGLFSLAEYSVEAAAEPPSVGLNESLKRPYTCAIITQASGRVSCRKEDRVLRDAFSILCVFVLTIAIVAGTTGVSGAGGISRTREPVVLTGGDLSGLTGTSPGLILGFAYDSGWVQIPIQVDEMDVVDFGTIYGTDPSGYTMLAYTDTSTFTGADSDTTFDADDELVFMVSDAGLRALGVGEPAGVVEGTGLEITILDPLVPDTGFVYLFESLGVLKSDAGADSIPYDFNLLSGDYKTTYNTSSGPNPEDSEVVTSAYRVHFSDRWIRDENNVAVDGATGVDILDRHRSLFAPGNCGRSEDTFSAGEGAFIVNRTGPVRALRGYVGCNSGPTTYRIHAFYEVQEEILTALRVHAISGILDIFDYSPEAVGMIFYDELNLDGAAVDGIPEILTAGEFSWEMITGAQGTVVHALRLVTDIAGFDYSSYYCDDSTPPEVQCTGDDYEYAASGFWEEDPIPNTDPGVGPYNIFEAHRTVVYAGPDQTTAFAQTCAQRVLNPLVAAASPFAPDTTASVEGSGATGEELFDVKVGPNPVKDRLQVSFRLSSGGNFRADLYDAAGCRIRPVVSGSWSRGSHMVTVDLSTVPPGIYFLRFRDGWGARVTRRVVIFR